MQMDALLVEHFHAAHTRQRSGVLSASGPDGRVRFAFSDGQPVAVEFPLSKERLLANALLEYHRIDGATYQTTLAGVAEGRPVAEVVAQAHAATEQEISRTTQAMVEDALLRVFAGRSQEVTFADGESADVLDYANSAMRLRIDAEQLLRTVKGRLDDQRALLTAFSDGWSVVFSFSERGSNSNTLSEAEKRVLDHVDGRRSLHDIALISRDSDLNMARMLRVLEGKQIVQRVVTSVITPAPTPRPQAMRQTNSGARPVTTAVAAPAAAAPAPAPVRAPIQDFVPVLRRNEPTGGGMVVVGTVVLTAMVLGLGVWSWQYYAAERELEALVQRVGELAAKGEWSTAEQLVASARSQAGADLRALRRVDAMEQGLAGALTRSLDAIAAQIEAGKFTEARRLFTGLPDSERVKTARARLDAQERIAQVKIAELESTVALALEGLRPLTATAAIVAAPTWISTGAHTLFERWIDIAWNTVIDNGQALVRRQAMLDALRTVLDEERLAVPATAYANDLEATKERIAALVALSSTAPEEAWELVAAEHLAARAEGGSLAPGIAVIRVAAEQMIAAKQGLRRQVLDLVQELDVRRVQQLAPAVLSATAPAVDTSARTCITGLVRAVDGQGPEEQVQLLEAVRQSVQDDSELAIAVAQRSERLRSALRTANTALETARSLIRDGNLVRAEHVLQEVLARQVLVGSPVRSQADQEMTGVRALLSRRARLVGELTRAVARGDTRSANDLAREMGLRYLPLAIDTLPPGAEVWRDGTLLGRTPLILEADATERVDWQLDLRLDGYRPLTVPVAQAEAGWRLSRSLERESAAVARVGQVTSQPAAVGDRVVVANRSSAWAVSTTGQVQEYPFTAGAFEQPVYAPASADADGILVATRDGAAMRIAGDGTAARLPLAAPTDQAPLRWTSPLILDRRWLIVAALDGSLQAIDERNPAIRWSSPGDGQWAGRPQQVGDRILLSWRSARVSMVSADDGRELSSANLPGPALAAWPVEGALAGASINATWSWDGVAVHTQSAPLPLAAAGPGVLVSATGAVLCAHLDGSWRDLGRIDPVQLRSMPFAWSGQAVLHLRSGVLVLGPRGFRDHVTDTLAPVLVDGRLAITGQDGTVRFYEP